MGKPLFINAVTALLQAHTAGLSEHRGVDSFRSLATSAEADRSVALSSLAIIIAIFAVIAGPTLYTIGQCRQADQCRRSWCGGDAVVY